MTSPGEVRRANTNMDMPLEEFGTLLDDAVNGSESAARALVDRYGKYLRPVVRRWLHERMRSEFDTMDFEQDVWKSFFGNSPTSDVLTSPGALIGYLRAIARNKVVDATRKNLGCQKRNKNKERAIEAISPDSKDLLDQKQATASQILMTEEEWQFVLGRQRPAYREILTRIRRGDDPGAISRELGISEKTVRRAVEKAVTLLTEKEVGPQL